jgi:hypothetical protein
MIASLPIWVDLPLTYAVILGLVVLVFKSGMVK